MIYTFFLNVLLAGATVATAGDSAAAAGHHPATQSLPITSHETMKNFLTVLTVLFTAAFATPSVAQEFSLGADLVSRYVWRGADFGESASIQPALSVNSGGLEVGTWASYSMDPQSADFNEHDIWIGYSTGPLSFGVTDYYFPNAGVDFFNFEGDGAGAHWIEPFVSLTGPETFPITFYASYFAYNDPDNSVYLNASYPFAIDGVDLSFGVGASATESALYGTDGFGVIDVMLTASKSVPLTDAFALPLSVAYVLNPYAEKSFLVFGLSF